MDIQMVFRWLMYACELFAMLTAFVSWQKLKSSHWKYFPFYLLMIVIVEIGGEYIWMCTTAHQLQHDLYLYFGIPIQFFFFYWIYYKEVPTTFIQRTALIGAITYAAISLAEWILVKKNLAWFSATSYTWGVLFLLILAIRYLYTFMNSDELLQFKKHLLFWISAGILIFYLGSLPYYGLPNLMRGEVSAFLNTYWIFPMILGDIMYIFFALGLLWKK